MENIFKNLSAGDTVEFGSYPQDLVESKALCAEIDGLCGSPKTGAWTDFGYAKGSGVYKDVCLDGKRYRSVFIKKRRMCKLLYEFSDYQEGRIYRFSFEPITWRVMKIFDGKALLVSEKLLDAQEFSLAAKNRRKSANAGGAMHNDGALVQLNNYAHSFIRDWLNGAFFALAFSASEREYIGLSAVLNGAETTKNPNNPFACADTSDRVFLLSFREAKTLFPDNKSRQKKATEYAKSQGCFAYRTHDAKYNNAVWWLRSPDGNYGNWVRCVGDGGGLGDGGFSTSQNPADYPEAVAPAIIVKLQ